MTSWVMRWWICSLVAVAGMFPAGVATGAEPELVRSVEQQPLAASTERLIQAMQYVGSPMASSDVAALQAAFKNPDARASVVEIQKILDQHVFAVVKINHESRVSAVEGPAKKELLQQGWRTFLVKVLNEARITPELAISSSSSLTPYMQGKGPRERPMTVDKLTTPTDVPHRFLDIDVFKKQPLKPELSGLEVEYRVVQFYSRDVGRREATLSFNVGQGTQDLGFRSDLPVLFECTPSVEVVLEVRDDDGSPTSAGFVIRDTFGRIYPNPARRIAPDFFFHSQVYRADGESVFLPSGKYSVTVTRGPEYEVLRTTLDVPPDARTHRQAFRLTRWVHPKTRGWFSGDHHVHAAGCAHYDSPTEGVGPGDMMRHILGEDLNVGCVLSWGPCWYTQKQNFEGKISALSRPNYLMRYDVEVSGFPSSHCGHLCLLGLKEDDYPGTTNLEDWPSWTMPVLEWGQKQDAVVGYSHSGSGLALPDIMPDGTRQFPARRGEAPNRLQGRAADTLPDDAMPRFDGIGANEFIVTGPLGHCDFISSVDTQPIWELNVWYHALNCGVTTRISGETDFPCIYGERVGIGRIYVKLPKGQPLDYAAWVAGVRDGRSYCGDGMSHVFDFRATGNGKTVAVGERGGTNEVSRLDLARPGKVLVEFDVAALIEPKPNEDTKKIKNSRPDVKPYWHIERCRIEDTRRIPVEIIVNGAVAAKKEIDADGLTQSLGFEVDIPQSAWVAVRILPSVHTNPIFVHVDNKPIRARKASADWCRRAVEVCWKAKEGRIRESERAAARAAYDSAAKYYETALAESVK